jgi:hypothetical protein
MKHLCETQKYFRGSIEKSPFLLVLNLFFVSFFFYFLFVINPSLYLIKNYREFFTDIYFFNKYFDFPGNPTEYFSRLISQFYNFPVIASLIVTSILYSIYWLGAFTFGKNKHSVIAAFVPVVMLVAMHNDYNHSLKFDIEVLFTLAISFIYFRFIRSKAYCRLLLYPILLCFLYFFTGIIPASLFFLAAVISEILSKERKYSLVIFLETLIALFFFNQIFFISYEDVSKEFRKMQEIYTLGYLPSLLFLSVLFVLLVNMLSNLRLETAVKPSHNVNSKNVFFKFRSQLVLLVILLLTVVTCYFSFDKMEKVKLSVQNYGRNREWGKVLELAEYADSFDRSEIIYTNRALYFTGRIYNGLFKYNQEMASNGLLATNLTSLDELVPNQDIYLDLGALSLSVVAGTEATNVYGANPYVLKSLTKAYLAMGYMKEAKKMLNLLDHTLFNKKWVRNYTRFINDTTLITTDAELGRYKRDQSCNVTVSKTTLNFNLYSLVDNDNRNKMAYDYLMFSAMLDKNMADFAVGLSGLKLFGYTHIPKLFFEGFIYYSLTSEESPINMEEFTYDQNIIDEFKAFQKDYVQLKNSPEEAQRYLFKRYGDTYWYYLKFPRLVNSKNFARTDEKLKVKERE